MHLFRATESEFAYFSLKTLSYAQYMHSHFA